jgi:hypothetical protein
MCVVKRNFEIDVKLLKLMYMKNGNKDVEA